MVIGFKLCRRNDRSTGGMCTGLNGLEASAGSEPAVEKDTLASLWTFCRVSSVLYVVQAVHDMVTGY